MREYVAPPPKAPEPADPNLEGLSTAELYRMLEILDMMEGNKMDKVSQRELDTLKFLMDAYQQ